MEKTHFKSSHPSWIKRTVNVSEKFKHTRSILSGLNTVCSSAQCPNQNLCFNDGVATFLILGNICTRNCRFCAVQKGTPAEIDKTEPARIAQATIKLKLSHIVITSATRDDLEDGGAEQFVSCIKEIRRTQKGVTVEVLTSDFKGSKSSLDKIIEAHPDVFGHNIETVPRMYPVLRPGADYGRSLDVIRYVSEKSNIITKSGMMLGVGEKQKEVIDCMNALFGCGCRVLTIGQYLSPSKEHFPVFEYIEPHIFEYLKCVAYGIGFSRVLSGPFVRSSYKAKMYYDGIKDMYIP